MQKNYYAIIPANVRYDQELTPNAKLLYGEITALCNEKGYCWAGNAYFSDLYKVTNRTITGWINSLEQKGYIQRTIIRSQENNQVEKRIITLSEGKNPQEAGEENFLPYRKKLHDPIEDNFRKNNTSINNTTNKTKEDIPYVEIITYLNDKALSSYRSTSKKTKDLIKARWKEGFTIDDFKLVIDKKSSEWLQDSKMNAYLRPETLFGTKFEGYLNQKVGEQDKKPPGDYDKLF
jgi:uncharacterized phage protein (TIGR02220 family)